MSIEAVLDGICTVLFVFACIRVMANDQGELTTLDNINAGSITALILLVIANAIIQLAHASLVNTQESQLQTQAESGSGSARRILGLLENPARLDITVKLSLTLLYFAIASILITQIIQPLVTSGDITNIAGVAILGIFAALVLIVTEIVPEGVGSAYSDTFAPLFIYPMSLLVILLTPLTIFLIGASKVIAGALGSRLVVTVTEEEIMTLVSAGHTGGTIEDEEKDMIYSVLRLGETTAREIMTPRIDIISAPMTTSIGEAVQMFIESGFSRIPVYEENIDHVVGLLYAKDVLQVLSNGNADAYKEKPIGEFIRPVHFVDEDIFADVLLKQLRERNIHIAIVADEYGGTSGLVTIENLIEEIVGDIRDEYDNEEEEFIQNQDGEYIIDAGMDLDDLNDLLELDLDSDSADTLGGYIFLMLGHIPRRGEVIETDELTIRIQSLEGRRIRKVKVIKKEPAEEADIQPEEMTNTS